MSAKPVNMIPNLSDLPYPVWLTLIGILFTLSLFLYHKLSKVKKQLLIIRQQQLLAQLNPHFVFNSLTAIQSYIFRNDPYQAGKYLSNFARLTRLILESSRMELCSIERENSILKHYLDLQTLRFDKRFTYAIEIDESLDTEIELIPPMLTQPFIENAIEHGFIHLKETGHIAIRYINSEDKGVIIEVEDNGIGIDSAKHQLIKKGRTHSSLATEITRERLAVIRRSMGLRIVLEHIDLKKLSPEKHGTLVRFTIIQK